MSKLLAAATVLVILWPLVSLDGASARLQGGGTVVSDSVVMIVQGTNDITPGTESDDDFYALRISSFDVPYEEARVYANVPDTAREIKVWTSILQLNNTSYGRETSGPMSGEFYVDIPPSFDREGTSYSTVDDQDDFSAPGSASANLTYSSGRLGLSTNSTEGSFISAPMPLASIHSIIAANLTVFGHDLANVSYAISNDNGTTWTTCANGTELEFPGTGTTLRVRLSFTGNASQGFDPQVTKFLVASRYAELSSEFTVHISYLWTAEFENKAATIDLTEAMDYSDDGTIVVMLYLLKGYSAQADGISLALDTSDAMNAYPGKRLYLNATDLSGTSPSMTLTIIKLDQPTPWALYIGGAGSAAVILGIIAYSRRRSAKGSAASPEEGAEGLAPEAARGEGLTDDDLQRRKDLIQRKKELLAEISAVDEKKASRSMGKEAADKERHRLKSEYKSVRNELARLSRRSEATVESARAGEMTDPYEAVLASLARIDEDFEKGRLPEKTHKSLRKEYVSRAAALMAARSSSSPGTEKEKLLEAISTLDAEHREGKIEDDVYEALKASYRSELAELMKKADETEEG